MEPPASRKAISRKRPISVTVLGESCHVTTYNSLCPLLVSVNFFDAESSALISSIGTGLIIVFITVVVNQYQMTKG